MISDKIKEAMSQGDRDIAVKSLELPSHLDQWLSEAGVSNRTNILDFGCGFGLTSWGIAVQNPASKVLGVDINDEHAECLDRLSAYGVSTLPDNLRFMRIRPGQELPEEKFDIVFSWSVFEHIHLGIMEDVLKDLKLRLAEDGHIFIQIAPLFFSAEGGHLWELGYYNWEHLRLQHSDVRSAASNHPLISNDRAQSLLGMYETLNRITAQDLIKYVERAGFEIVKKQLDLKDGEIPKSLLTAYNEDALRTFQIVLLLKSRVSA